MGAQLNIKCDDAYRLVSRLAESTGKILTTVVTKALEAALDRQQRLRDVEDKVNRMVTVAQEILSHLRLPITYDHSGLYNANGLLL